MQHVFIVSACILFAFTFNMFSSAFGKTYQMIGNPDNPKCFLSKPNKTLSSIRSVLECSAKCSRNVSSTDKEIACNAFTYLSNNASNLENYCHLFNFSSESQYKNVTNSTLCQAYGDVEVREEISKNPNLTLSKFCNFPFTYNGGLFYSCSNALPMLNLASDQYMCIVGKRQLATCIDPEGFSAVNETIPLIIPTFANTTLVTSVNGWIVIQQRVNGSQDFNLPWNDYKSGFGVYDQNFWLGLEKMHQLTTSADYRLRFEVLMASYWVSDEYDHFRVNSELEMYSLNVSGYSGDNADVLNSPYNAVMIQNGMKFTTTDKDNDLLSTDNCARLFSGGNWFKNCNLINLNGVYGSSLYYYKGVKDRPVKYCRMMIKLNS